MIDWSVFFQIATPVVTACVTVFVTKYFSERERLIAHYGHIASHALNSVVKGREVTHINTHAVVIRNDGNKTATNVRISHNVLPDVKIYPETDYRIMDLPSGGRELLIPRITPKKDYTISYLYFPPITYSDIRANIESDAGPAKVIDVRLQRIFPWWFNLLCLIAVILGLVTFFYIVYEVIRAVVS